MENYPAFYDKPWPLEKQTLPVPGSEAPGYSPIYRNVVHPTYKTNHTIYDVFLHAISINPKADCAGWRPYDPITKQHANQFEWLSYEEVAEQRTALGSALSKLARHGTLGDGLSQTEWSIGIWALNRPEFLVIDQAALAYSRRVVSLYDSYDTPTASYILDHAEARIIFTTPSHVAAVLSEKQAGNLPLLKALVIIDPFRLSKNVADNLNPDANQRDLLAKQWAATVGVSTYAWAELLQLGRANLTTHLPPKYESIASFCYTSGTTGKPKAVIITAGMSAFCCAVFQFQLSKPQTMISYLPTAHIYARGVEYVTLSNGGRIGYFQGDTTRLIEDVQLLKPTFFPSVPRVLNRIAALIEAQANAPGLKAKLLKRAIDAKIANHDADGTLTHAIYDRLVFKKVKAVLGGNVELMVSGSAPIRPEVLKLLRVAFVCDVREGYGQTENAGFCLIMNPNDKSLGSCGPCWPGVEIRLRDIPEMGYTAKDKPFPRGELLVRGPSVFPGYYKDEAKTKETIDEDGWLRSGDVVLIDQYNRCRIIDRVKSLVKLSQGEYVAIDALTEFYGRNPLAAQILVHGDSYRDFLVGVVVPEPTTFAPFASKILGRTISPEDASALADACKNEQVVEAFLAEYTAIARANKLKGFEFLKGIHLTTDAFSVENGLLTPTLKLKRHEAVKVYADVIDAIYARGPANVSASAKGKL